MTHPDLIEMLKPCPFCGKNLVERPAPYQGTFWHGIDDYKCVGDISVTPDKREAWNTRTNDQAISTLTAEVEELRAYAREASRELTHHSGGGVYLAMKAASHPLEQQQVVSGDTADQIDEAMRAFHYEAFRAGVCYGRDEWPQSDEEWADLDRGIQSEAVGEHYEGWSDETIGKLTAALTASGMSRMREALEAIDNSAFIGSTSDSQEAKQVALESIHDIARTALQEDPLDASPDPE